MNRVILTAFLIMFLAACKRPSTESPYRVTAEWSYDVHGLYVFVPPGRKAVYTPRSNGADWQLDDGTTLAANMQSDGAFQLLRNGKFLGTAKAGDHVEFLDTGQLLYKPAKTK